MSALVVVGASYAGIQTALHARAGGFSDAITVICDEDRLPYQRPPLSKDFLLGRTGEDKLVLRDAAFFRTERIDLVLGRRAVAVDRRARRIELDDGAQIAFDGLVIATGSRARTLSVPGAEADGVCYLRSVTDAIDFKSQLADATDVVIIGGGFIGLEVASSAATLGKNVAVIETLSRPLERAVSPFVSEFLLNAHRRAGVEVMTGESVTAIEARNGRVAGVALASGRKLPADLVLAGIGGIANDELAAEAGLPCAEGILVDDHARAAAPDIYAVGDCARHSSRFAQGWVRLESVQNAQDQARAAGLAIAGRHAPYDSVPWFWSDQYHHKLQIVGLGGRHDRAVIRGSSDDGRFSVFLYKGETLIAVESVNRAGDQLAARRLIAAGVSPAPEDVEDPAFDLKSLVKSIDATSASIGNL